MNANLFDKRLRGAAVIVVAALAPFFSVRNAPGFALLGPYADWMTQTNVYRQSSDIGGPMNINEGYRWNVPVVTYGFDKSFMDYFGSNGVAAVESAIQILNDLPGASDIVLSNYPVDTRRLNSQAATQNLYDLKSITLMLLIEQFGLGQPTRNVLDLRGWVPQLQSPFSVCGTDTCPLLESFPDLIIRRNFDPETLAPSFAVNSVFYSCFLYTNAEPNTEDLIEFPVNAPTDPYSAVADGISFWYSGLTAGTFYGGLTRDDVGGLRYLLSSTNVNHERWLRDEVLTHPRRDSKFRARGAWRPGVEKISFEPQPVGRRGKFRPLVIRYSDTFLANGAEVSQPVKRVITKPDFLFSADDSRDSSLHSSFLFSRSGTTNWINNAELNGAATNAGPGVIRPQVKITFYDQVGLFVSSSASFPPQFMSFGWGSFDNSTNPLILYPPHAPTSGLTVQFHFLDSAALTPTVITNSTFHLKIPMGALAALETSTNRNDWISLATVTNTGAVVDWTYIGPVGTGFRVIRQ